MRAASFLKLAVVANAVVAATSADGEQGAWERDSGTAAFVSQSLCDVEADRLAVEFAPLTEVGNGAPKRVPGFRWLRLRPAEDGYRVLGAVPHAPGAAEAAGGGWLREALPASWQLAPGDCVGWYAVAGSALFGYRHGGPRVAWSRRGLPAPGVLMSMHGEDWRAYGIRLVALPELVGDTDWIGPVKMSLPSSAPLPPLSPPPSPPPPSQRDRANTLPTNMLSWLATAEGAEELTRVITSASEEEEEDAHPRFGHATWAAAPLASRVLLAARGLRSDFGLESLHGRTFLDVGDGSGVVSAAAVSLNVSRVISVVAPGTSMQAARQLRAVCERLGLLSDVDWQVLQGSILDLDFVASLPASDLVHSYGALQDAGDPWQGLRNVAQLVVPSGLLYIGLHLLEQDTGHADQWLPFKQEFNTYPEWMQEHALLAWLVAELGDDMESCYERQPEEAAAGDWPRFQLALACVSERFEAYDGAGRGRDLLADARDRLGGPPRERVSADGVIRFFQELKPSMKVLRLQHDTIGGFLLARASNADVFASEPRGAWSGSVLVEVSPTRTLREYRELCGHGPASSPSRAAEQECESFLRAFTEEAAREVSGDSCYAHVLSGPALARAALMPERSVMLEAAIS